MQRLRGYADTLRANFFFVPAVAVVLAFIGGRLAVGVKVGAWVGDSTVDSARAILSTVASATITFASISFSVALLIMQQGSSQFSPRVVHLLVRDPFNRRVIGFVLGTFTYCLVVLQRTRGALADGNDPNIPEFAVALGLALGVLSVLAIVGAINHTSRQMDVSEILGRIVDEACDTPASPDTSGLEPCAPIEPPANVSFTEVRFARDGWVRQIDRDRVVTAAPPGGVVRMATDAGRYAIRSSLLATIWPAVPDDRIEHVNELVRDSVQLGPTRTMSEDGGYGVRQLVDIALKALSPGINDPTTAMDAIFHLGSVLSRRLQAAPVPVAYMDSDERRLLTPEALTDDELAELSIAELRRAAADMPAVSVYLLEMVAEVVDAARSNGAAGRVGPFLEQVRLLLAGSDAAELIDEDHAVVRAAYHRRFTA